MAARIPYCIVWIPYRPGGQPPETPELEESIQIPVFLEGARVAQWEKRGKLTVTPMATTLGMLVGMQHAELPGTMMLDEPGYYRSRYREFLEINAELQGVSLEELVMHAANHLHRVHGRELALDALHSGRELLPGGKRIAWAYVVHSWMLAVERGSTEPLREICVVGPSIDPADTTQGEKFAYALQASLLLHGIPGEAEQFRLFAEAWIHDPLMVALIERLRRGERLSMVELDEPLAATRGRSSDSPPAAP